MSLPDVKTVARLRQAGMYWKQIAERLGIGRETARTKYGPSVERFLAGKEEKPKHPVPKPGKKATIKKLVLEEKLPYGKGAFLSYNASSSLSMKDETYCGCYGTFEDAETAIPIKCAVTHKYEDDDD